MVSAEAFATVTAIALHTQTRAALRIAAQQKMVFRR